MTPLRIKPLLLAGTLALLAGCEARHPASAEQVSPQRFASQHGTLEVFPVATGLEHPWGLAFLPDGRMLVTERPGRLRLVYPDGRLSDPIAGVPQVFARGQGGLLDVALDPDFEDNRLVYLSYAEPGENGAGTAVARARLAGDSRLEELQVIFRQQPKLGAGHHFGSRLVFDREGRLYVTAGDRGEPERAQRLDQGQGKIFRIERDGGIPADNPFVGRDGAQAAIWSWGHRNVQGAALNPDTGELWQTEHGPKGGDELNIARAGLNYGWPAISHGVNYDGTPVGEGLREAPGMEQPLHHWTPSIGASGLAFYTGERFPAWRGDLFAGGLALRKLVRLDLEDGKLVGSEDLLVELGERIRDVRQGPDGYLYLLTDAGNGKLLRVGLAAD
ncbi:PQQ-dependent sugar dehydrogenase [Arenimonas fontis]|uniref:PQQ-dependent sugar dehydrogenase n=1 Tax=Arenimonas fontis TaxID=2608255 RepID=A0A5B2Z6Q6_9GAMM|nr:PQQ-dependent sugar dehydrogenase [Arenimonas fontis]KAA2284458.1 PQQ-dependent sugar dehydrogenase [Arenimonas fontis]